MFRDETHWEETIMSEIVNFALLGCGRIAKKHAEVIAHQLSGSRLIAVCDINQDRVNAMAEEFDVPGFSNLDDMMKELGDQIHVVNVLTPSGYHPKNVVDVADYGCHVVTEKPMGLSLEDARYMTNYCEQKGVKLFVVKQNRYNKPVQKVKKAYEDGRLGRVSLASVCVRWSRDQAYYDQDDWRGTWLLDGGVFSNQASHHIDLICWLLGEVESVSAYIATQLVDIEAEDTGIAILKFKNGTLCTLEATTATRPRDLEASVCLMGEFGTACIGGFAVNKMNIWDFKEPIPGDEHVLQECNTAPPNVYGFGHKAYLQNVVDAIQGKKQVAVGGSEGLKSLKVINALYASAITGREIQMDHFNGEDSPLGQRSAAHYHQGSDLFLPVGRPKPISNIVNLRAT
ncbi:O-antigen biosynthesis protein WlbA [Litoribacillus peritrichatus]|uniref:O-antigen biosynthesis protein WlbA n=2 Tax=Litoribacillus peritrichatus TaxID=718191 RepID=A0ABP7M9A9_9GAMM